MTSEGAERPQATVVGNALVDVIVTRQGQFPRLGGAGLNVAVLLAQGGLKTSLVTSLADDLPGRAIRLLASRLGIQLIESGRVSATPQATVHLDADKPSYEFDLPAYLPFDFSPAVQLSASTADLVVVNAFDYSGLSQVDSLRHLLDSCGGWRVVDPNVRPGLLRDIGAAAHGLRRLLPAIDILKVSDEDVEHLGGAVSQAGEDFLTKGVKVLFLTRGARGAMLYTVAGTPLQAAAQVLPVQVVDTVGAGDAALAALLVGAVCERPGLVRSRGSLGQLAWGSHLDRAMAAAALACQQRGGPAGPVPEDEALSPAR